MHTHTHNHTHTHAHTHTHTDRHVHTHAHSHIRTLFLSIYISPSLLSLPFLYILSLSHLTTDLPLRLCMRTKVVKRQYCIWYKHTHTRIYIYTHTSKHTHTHTQGSLVTDLDASSLFAAAGQLESVDRCVCVCVCVCRCSLQLASWKVWTCVCVVCVRACMFLCPHTHKYYH